MSLVRAKQRVFGTGVPCNDFSLPHKIRDWATIPAAFLWEGCKAILRLLSFCPALRKRRQISAAAQNMRKSLEGALPRGEGC